MAVIRGWTVFICWIINMSFSFQSLINALQSFFINGCNSEFNDRLEPGLLEGIVRG